MTFSLDEVEGSWRPFFKEHLESINAILDTINEPFEPPREKIFRSFTQPLDQIRVLILGQDPYPGEGVADGLAFSSSSDNPIPASLRNIFKEYSTDLDLPIPRSPDLTPWSQRGVMLLNRTLTTAAGSSNAHLSTGWSQFTGEVAKLLSARGVVAILWGNNARELAPLFEYVIESVHPSPLSARKGFFSSKPFTRANDLLVQQGRAPIDWKL